VCVCVCVCDQHKISHKSIQHEWSCSMYKRWKTDVMKLTVTSWTSQLCLKLACTIWKWNTYIAFACSLKCTATAVTKPGLLETKTECGDNNNLQQSAEMLYLKQYSSLWWIVLSAFSLFALFFLSRWVLTAFSRAWLLLHLLDELLFKGCTDPFTLLSFSTSFSSKSLTDLENM